MRLKQLLHRGSALLLALAMCLSLLPTTGLAAETTYTQVTSSDDFTSGTYVMVVSSGYAMGVLDGDWITATEVTGTPTTGAPEWTLTVSGSSVTITDANGVTIAPKGGNTNGISSGSYSWSWSFADGAFTFAGTGDDTVTLASNKSSENKFRAYKSTTVSGNSSGFPSAFTLYKVSSGGSTNPGTVAAPQADPQAGEVVSGTEITLTCSTDGASIYYTLDGTDPTSASTAYSDSTKPVISGDVGASVTLKAVAILNETSSEIQSLTYTIKAAESSTLESGTYVIYAPAYNIALSSEMASSSSYYQKGVAVTIAEDGTMSGYGTTEIWTITAAEDGSYTFAQDGQNLGMGDKYSSMSLGGVNDDWTLTALGGGLYNVSNVVRGYYIEWYASKSNWSTYNSSSAATDDQYQLAFYKVEGETPVTYPVAAGDEVAIYNTSAQKAIDANSEMTGATTEITDGKAISSGDITFVVETSGDYFRFKTKSGDLYLTSPATGGTLTLEQTATDYSNWVLESTDGGWLLKNASAAYNEKEQYVEYYSTFKTYSYSSKYASSYVFEFYPVGEKTADNSNLVVSASPASGASMSIGQTVTLSTVEGAEIYYTTDGTEPDVTVASQKYSEPIEITELPMTIKAVAYRPADGQTEAATGNVIAFTYKAADTLDGYNLYFGQLHSHTNISDGAGSVEEAFEHASQVENLDFLAVTDHSNSFDNDTDADGLANDGSGSSEWVEGHTAADNITTDTFVGIYGFEMTWSDGFGHINTFNTPGFETRSNSSFGNKSGSTEGYELYYDTLVSVESSLSQFNHPGTTFGDFQDFAFYDAAIDQRITLIEVGNGEGAIGSSGYFPSYEYYTRALDKGWHVAPSNNQDNHKGNWGDSNTARSVVLAKELTRDAIYDAIANYRVYATEDNDLSILYSLNGSVMGSILPAQESVTITATISDPTDSGDAKVEVIVNGGKVLSSQTLADCNGEVSFTYDSNDYSYYYLRITQADKNIAVTAPVWTGEGVNAGISQVTCDSDLVVKDESVNITTEVYNNTTSTMVVTAMTFTEGDTVLKELTADELAEAGLSSMACGATVSYVLPYTPAQAGSTSITVTVIATLGDSEYTFSEVLQLSVTDPSLVTRILVDGTHYNDYVTGYYSGNMGNFSELAATLNAQVTIKQPGETITAEDLEDVALLVVSAPLKKTTNGNSPTTFSDDFIQLVADYAKNGGTVILCGIADYQDSSDGAPYCSTEQINPILEAMGATMRLNDDEVMEDNTDYNGGSSQRYRVYMDIFNTDSGDALVNGLFDGISDKRYSAYSGASITVNDGTWLVKGSADCYSINSRARTNNGTWYSTQEVSNASTYTYSEDTAVVKKGEVVTLATETVGEGRVYLAGTVFLSDFEITSDGSSNDYGDASYANKVILTNILKGIAKEPTVSTIAEARTAWDNGNGKGAVYTVVGKVTATNVSPNAFYDTLYIQDETGGMDIYPVATVSSASDTSAYLLGQTVQITGALDAYQGDIELRAISIKVIDDSTDDPVEPEEVTLAQAADYDTNGGKLVQVSGTVVSSTQTSGLLDTIILTDGTTEYRLLFNNYITPDIDLSAPDGSKVTAIGIVYMDPDGVCLRIRDRAEVTVETVSTIPVYRLYNPYTQEHLYCTDESEKASLTTLGWTVDGIAWYAPTEGTPIYRLYNSYDDFHFYTTSEEEIESLTANGWTVDGIMAYSADESGIPVYRLFNPYEQKNYHLFTASEDEITGLVALGWKREGIAWYAARN